MTRALRRTAGTGQPDAGSRTSITESADRSAPPAEDESRTSGALAAPGVRRGRPLNWKFVPGVLGVLALAAASLLAGVYDMFGGDGGAAMVQIAAVPCAIATALAGAAMAMCGLGMPLLTQNRSAEPTTTGTTE